MLQEKCCSQEICQEAEEMLRWKQWEQKDIDPAWKQVCSTYEEQLLDEAPASFNEEECHYNGM